MSVATASRNGDVVWDAKGSEVVGLKAAHGLTTYWKGQPLKRKAQSEQGDERPAKKQKQKQQKKQHRRFTEPVAEPHEYNEGVQNYLEALEVEKNKALSKSVRPESEAMDKDIDMEPMHSLNPVESIELSANAAAALASTSSMLSNRSGAATPPHSSQPILNDKLLLHPPTTLSPKQLADRLLMPPPPRPIPLYRPPPTPTASKIKILAWKIDPSHRCLSYLVFSPLDPAAPPL
jgi:hypothetical protein